MIKLEVHRVLECEHRHGAAETLDLLRPHVRQFWKAGEGVSGVREVLRAEGEKPEDCGVVAAPPGSRSHSYRHELRVT